MSRTALVVGASRALGLELACELLERDWEVIATVRGDAPDRLTDGGARIEHLDITDEAQIVELNDRLAGADLDLLFVNAGITNDDVPVSEVPTEDFVRVMVTNALGPMRVIEGLRDRVRPDGTIAVMSSRQGSVSFNTRGGHEVYRASKSALNQLMRSYAARTADDPRTLLLIHPGWVRTELGGPGAQLEPADSVRGVVDVLEAHAGDGGLQFLGHDGGVVPW